MGVQERGALLPEKGLFPIGKEGWLPLNRNLCNIKKEERFETLDTPMRKQKWV